MTYIDLVNRYWRMDLEYNFSHLETHLYFQLLDLGNQSGWRKAISISNKRLSVLVRTANKCVIKARQRLHDVGLFYYDSGTTRRPGKYILDPGNFPDDSNGDLQNDSLPKATKKVTNQVTNKEAKKDDWLPEETNKVTTKVTKVVTNQVTNQVTNRDGDSANTAQHKERKIRLDKNRLEDKKEKEIIKEKEKIPETTKKIYDFFRDNFKNSEKMIQMLKEKEGLGEEFDLFMEYCLFDKGCGKYILEAKAPISYIKKIADVQWPHYQEWKGKKHKEAVDLAGLRALNLSNAYHG